MSSALLYDSDDERDNFDVERRQIDAFQNNFLAASIASSDDDDEGIIDGTKIPSSSKLRSRARHSFLDISILSSPSSSPLPDENEENPFDIIAKSIDVDSIKPVKKKKKSLGVPKSRLPLDTTDIYEQDDSNHSRHSDISALNRIVELDPLDDGEDGIQSSKKKSAGKVSCTPS